MKKTFAEPEMEIILIRADEIIVTSGNCTGPNATTEMNAP